MLVELGAVRRLHFLGKADDAGQRHQFAIAGTDVVVLQGFLARAELIIHLRNHLVRPAFHVEAVDVAATEHAGQGLPNILH